jgi:hypothetical protein
MKTLEDATKTLENAMKTLEDAMKTDINSIVITTNSRQNKQSTS